MYKLIPFEKEEKLLQHFKIDLIVVSVLCDRIWVKLISNLNAVRQPKWSGSCLEECHCRSLEISKDTVSKRYAALYTVIVFEVEINRIIIDLRTARQQTAV